MNHFTRRAKEFLTTQDRAWPMLRQHRALLANAPVRVFEFDGFVVRVQLNLGRLSFARNRPGNGECFLCDPQRPIEQKHLDLPGGFRLMCNPYPILPEHFTIVHERHSPQRIMDCIGAMLDLAELMGEYFTVFYNGPQCGASAPNHLHLQAGPSGFFPATAECPRLGTPVAQSDGWRMSMSDRYLRRFMMIESEDRQAMLNGFGRLYEAQLRFQPAAAEPMMNILCNRNGAMWRMLVFPRAKHRPAAYFAAEDQRLLLSPGAVDVGGVMVLPDESQFNRITSEQIVEAYGDVTLDSEAFAALIGIVRY